MSYDKYTRIDHKRGHQWFIGNSEQELFSNKKQAVESIHEIQTPASTALSGSFLHGGSSSWSGSQRVDYYPYGPKPVPSPIFADNNNSPDNPASINMEKTSFENRFKNDSLISQSMSQAAEDPQFHNTGLRKVRVNEVTAPQNSSPEPLSSSIFVPVESNKNIMGSYYLRSGNNYIGSGLTYNSLLYNPASSKTNGNFTLNNHYYNGINNSMLSIGQTFDQGSYYHSLGHYGKENAKFMSAGPFDGKIPDNFFTIDPFYAKTNETFMPTGFVQDEDNAAIPYSDETPDLPSMVENSDKGKQSKAISVAGFVGPEERGFMCSSYGVLPNHHSSAQSMEASREKDAEVQQNCNVNQGATSKGDGAKKIKDGKAKKESSSNFPSNVKSLLSTGIFDGVPVKYVSWTREKSLRGVVKGSGYLCSCEECKLSKAINAYEFERHAGGKTKHPNNHIYFENGKTVYAVVLELKATPQEKLFEVIQNVTGSVVNHQNFTTWKDAAQHVSSASYQAATRELQRIYGKDEVAVSS
ncbi:acyl-CoA N-acyltransferase [Striga asiatica]|uniref:Acyl-CoA N-acyltransferase n=1 Tax=Striga asiatica TaxID=4170 RepID=A0A5A7QTI8_STRAF|nr:acyl-CoA N-acyltransferase [Striga asiatica]